MIATMNRSQGSSVEGLPSNAGRDYTVNITDLR
jgi:hypothetical protein